MNKPALALAALFAAATGIGFGLQSRRNDVAESGLVGTWKGTYNTKSYYPDYSHPTMLHLPVTLIINADGTAMLKGTNWDGTPYGGQYFAKVNSRSNPPTLQLLNLAPGAPGQPPRPARPELPSFLSDHVPPVYTYQLKGDTLTVYLTLDTYTLMRVQLGA